MPIRHLLSPATLAARRSRAVICCLLWTLAFAVSAHPRARAQDDLRVAAGQLVTQGGRFFDSGQYNRALDCWQRALNVFQRAGDGRNAGVVLTNLGLVYSTLGQKAKALEFYERALALVDDSNPAALATLLGNMGNLAINMGRADAAVRYFKEAVAIEEQRGDRSGYAAALDGLAQAYGHQRQFDLALRTMSRALTVAETTGNLRDIARILNNMGATAKAKGDYDVATQYLTRSLDLKRKFAGRAELATGLTNLALIYFDRGRLDNAAAAFAEAISHNEVISLEVRDAAKVGDFQDWFRSSLYRRYSHVLANQGKPEEALRILERGRNQGLARQAAQNRADFSRVLGPVDGKRLHDAQAEFNNASNEMRKVEGLEFLADEASASPGTRAILDARTRYEQAERNLDAVRDDLTARNAAYRRLSGIAPPTTAELRNLAEQHPDTLYLEWAIGAEATSLQFALSKQDGVKAFVLDTGEEALRKQVHAWREAIHKEDSQAEIAAAQSLYTTLFASVEKAGLLKPEKFARLVLVGDGPLLEMPFAALCDSEGKRLVERMPLAVSGSFGVLTWPDGKSRGEGAPLIAAAPSSPGAPPLPGARKEGQAIARLLSGSELLVGEAVTKERVVERLADASLLHFATHGLLDREDGLGCGLLMASQKGGDDLEVLEARELISMRIGAQMAVLSACDTGEGQNSGGEGLLGLTWAFRAAGCPSIAATLWSVEDESAGQLMTRFYTELRSGMRKDEAMRKAMLAVKAAHPAPFYWAAFQLYGETSPLSQ